MLGIHDTLANQSSFTFLFQEDKNAPHQLLIKKLHNCNDIKKI